MGSGICCAARDQNTNHDDSSDGEKDRKDKIYFIKQDLNKDAKEEAKPENKKPPPENTDRTAPSQVLKTNADTVDGEEGRFIDLDSVDGERLKGSTPHSHKHSNHTHSTKEQSFHSKTPQERIKNEPRFLDATPKELEEKETNQKFFTSKNNSKNKQDFKNDQHLAHSGQKEVTKPAVEETKQMGSHHKETREAVNQQKESSATKKLVEEFHHHLHKVEADLEATDISAPKDIEVDPVVVDPNPSQDGLEELVEPMPVQADQVEFQEPSQDVQASPDDHFDAGTNEYNKVSEETHHNEIILNAQKTESKVHENEVSKLTVEEDLKKQHHEDDDHQHHKNEKDDHADNQREVAKEETKLQDKHEPKDSENQELKQVHEENLVVSQNKKGGDKHKEQEKKSSKKKGAADKHSKNDKIILEEEPKKKEHFENQSVEEKVTSGVKPEEIVKEEKVTEKVVKHEQPQQQQQPIHQTQEVKTTKTEEKANSATKQLEKAANLPQSQEEAKTTETKAGSASSEKKKRTKGGKATVEPKAEVSVSNSKPVDTNVTVGLIPTVEQVKVEPVQQKSHAEAHSEKIHDEKQQPEQVLGTIISNESTTETKSQKLGVNLNIDLGVELSAGDAHKKNESEPVSTETPQEDLVYEPVIESEEISMGGKTEAEVFTKTDTHKKKNHRSHEKVKQSHRHQEDEEEIAENKTQTQPEEQVVSQVSKNELLQSKESTQDVVQNKHTSKPATEEKLKPVIQSESKQESSPHHHHHHHSEKHVEDKAINIAQKNTEQSAHQEQTKNVTEEQKLPEKTESQSPVKDQTEETTTTEQESPTKGTRSSNRNQKMKTVQPRSKPMVQYVVKDTSATEKKEEKSQSSEFNKKEEVKAEVPATKAKVHADSPSLLTGKELETTPADQETVQAGPKFSKKWLAELSDTVPTHFDITNKEERASVPEEHKTFESSPNHETIHARTVENTPRHSEALSLTDSQTSETPRSSKKSKNSKNNDDDEEEPRRSKKSRKFRKYPTMKK